MKTVFDRDAFEHELHVITPDDAEYESARQIWNAMVERKPAFIIRCADAADVPLVVRFACDRGLELAIRGGGHNIAGSALCDDGVVLDMSGMTRVLVQQSFSAERRRDRLRHRLRGKAALSGV